MLAVYTQNHIYHTLRYLCKVVIRAPEYQLTGGLMRRYSKRVSAVKRAYIAGIRKGKKIARARWRRW